MTDKDTQGSLRRTDEILERALELKGGERDAYLDHECADNTVLRSRVDALLKAAEATTGVLRRGGAFSRDLLHGMAEGSREADRIGRYELLEELGSGGMGVVYRARRIDGAYEQTVAVKLLKPGASEEAMARFDLERQILATLDHPNVARLLDGGVTEYGEPYLVVEFVKGTPIDEYCDNQDLGLNERLQIIAKLCDAVHEAHRRLIVHRDIKPANILIAQSGEPKLLDFGIAKPVKTDTDSSDLTAAQQQVMTLQYASPEQYRGLPVTVASDVYQLGLVAYEVLTGAKPYVLSGTPPSTAERLITVTEPPPPSAAASTPDRKHQVKGEVDTIVMKAIRKEPDRRYDSALAMREDIERFLTGHPITARKNSFAYRSSKFIRRHAFATSIVAALAALFLVSSIAFTVQLIKERDRTTAAAALARERQLEAESALIQSEEVLDYVVALFGEVTPDATQGEPVSVRALLDAGRSKLDDRPDLGTVAHLRLLETLGRLYRMRGELDTAEELLHEARDLAQQEQQRADKADPEVALREAYALRELGKVSLRKTQFDQAVEQFEEALAIYSKELGPRSKDVGFTHMFLSDPLLRLGRHDEGLASAEAADSILKEQLGEDDVDSLVATRVLGEALIQTGRAAEAVDLVGPAVERLRQVAPETSHLGGALSTVARAQSSLGNYEEAVRLLEECAVIFRRIYEPGQMSRMAGLGNLGSALQRVGRPEEAVEILREVISESEVAGNPSSEAASRESLAFALTSLERGDEALNEFDKVLALRERTLPTGHPSIGLAINNRAGALLRAGRTAEAERDFHRAIEIMEPALGASHLYLSYPMFNLAHIERDRGNIEAAAELSRKAFLIRDQQQNIDSSDRQASLQFWRAALGELGREEEAGALERFQTERFADSSEEAAPEG